MTRLQAAVLDQLQARGELSVVGLRKYTGRRVTSAVVEPLVALGFIRREQAAMAWYTITHEGREAHLESMRRRWLGQEA